MHIAELRVENSGIPQGTFLKRHRIPKSPTEFFSIADLRLGAEITVYGKVFRITGCDEFTKVCV